MKRKQLLAIGLGVATAAALLTGCSAPASTGVTQNSKAPVVAWMDGTRIPAAKAWLKAHPGTKVTVESIASDNASKIALATKSGSGLPDVVFLGQPDDLASVLTNAVNFPLPLDGVVSKSVLNGFADGTVARCTYGGKVYCLPNDIAQTVLFYNKTLFKQFGYTVPTTFAQWQSLSDKLAKDHPGYSLGSVSDRYGLYAYFGSSGCQFAQTSSPTNATVNLSSANCKEAAALMTHMIANGTLSTLDPFSPGFTNIVTSGKLLATISPSWMGDFGIKPNYKTNGDFAAAAMPKWANAKTNYSGTVGGGIWMVSAKTKNQKLALKFVTAMTSDPTYAASGSTFPADKASAKKWLNSKANDAWYANDPTSVFTKAASTINPSIGYVRYLTSVLDSFNSTILKSTPATVDSSLTTFGDQVTSAAKSAGYKTSK